MAPAPETPVRARPRPGERRLVVPVLAVVAVGSALTHLVRPTGLVGQCSYLGGLVVAAVLAWVGVTRLDPGRRGPWRRVALGVTLTMAADVVYQAQTWLWGSTPDVSAADLLWLGSYGALAAGLVALRPPARSRRGVGVDLNDLIESLVVAVVALLVVWEVALADLLADSSVADLSKVTWTAYPVLDVVLLALVVRVAIDRHQGLSPPLLMASLGATCWMAADFGFLVDTDGSAGRWLDVGWMVALILLGGSALSAGAAEGPGGTVRPRRTAGRRMWTVMWPLLLPGGFELRAYLAGEDTNPVPLLVVTATLVALATVRGHRLLGDAEAARATVEARELHFRRLTANSADAVIVLDDQGRVKEGSRNLARLVGIDPAEIIGVPVTDGSELVDRAAVRALLARALAAPGAVLEGEVGAVHRDGRDLALAARVVNLLDDPAVAGVVVNLHDVTDRRRAERDLVHQAFHDGLTGLANRALFSDRVEQALRRAGRTGCDPAIVFVDIDGFKTVNDRFGHAAGDTLLREISARLQDAVRTTDTVARLGGDELAVLIEQHHHHADEAGTTAERILQALSVPIEVDGQLIAVTASVGVAVAEPASTSASLLRNADIAMYRAKAGGKGRVVLYDAAMGAEAGEAVQMRADLATAVERAQLEVHYQPVVELAGERVVGFEALLRWRHPQLGLLGPDRFIPVAEETGLIVPIGRWVLDTACATAAAWLAAGLDRGSRLTMAVNLSARQLADDDLVADVEAVLARSGLEPARLVLEMTETALVADPIAAADRLRSLSDLGVRLAVDDFGTGYSSLSYLRQFPIHILKIDRSFVETITDEARIPPIVRGLLDLGRTLQLEVVAEGIERDVQRSWLRDANCDLGQGFFFARPLTSGDAELLLARTGPDGELDGGRGRVADRR